MKNYKLIMTIQFERQNFPSLLMCCCFIAFIHLINVPKKALQAKVINETIYNIQPKKETYQNVVAFKRDMKQRIHKDFQVDVTCKTTKSL